MPSVWVIKSVATLIVSLLIGFIFFYILSPLRKDEKKQQLEEIASLIINFVIFIWIGKIIWHFSMFIQDPLAVLAYPSHSYAFYIALLLVSVNVGYKVKRHQIQVVPLLYSFMPIFLVASFIYEFIQMNIFDEGLSWAYLGVLMLLIILWLFLDGRVSKRHTAFSILIAWNVGKIALSLILPFTTIFGYMISTTFLIILLIFVSGLYITIARKEK